jgi:ribokinase
VKNNMTKIVIVGSLNMDLVVQVPTIPKPGETVLGKDFENFPGGKGANQAVAAARLGASVTLIGQVGVDTYGESLVNNLVSEGVNVDCVFIDERNATGVAMISVDASGQNSIAVASGANFTLTKEHILSAWEKLGDIDILIMPLETPPDTILEAARLAKRQGVTVVLNPAPARFLDGKLLSQVDILVPNEHEIFQVSEYYLSSNVELIEVKEAARTLIAQGVNAVVTTLGSRGVSIVENSKDEVLLPPFPVKVLDTTAAGDAFVAALAVGIGEGKTFTEACYFANAIGALTVTKKGAQPSLPTRSEVNEFLGNQEVQ